jgi:hypothetical protein
VTGADEQESSQSIGAADRPSGRTDVLCARSVREHPNHIGATTWILPRTCCGPAVLDWWGNSAVWTGRRVRRGRVVVGERGSATGQVSETR